MNPKTEYSLEDKELVEKVLCGDTQAFAIIIKNTERLVAQIVFKMVGDPEMRKDIAQDVYLKAFKNLSGFKFQSKLSTWIGRITYNTCLNYLEKKKSERLADRFPDYETDDEAIDHSANTASTLSSNDVELALFQEELAEILKAELETLPPIYRTLITLYHNEELSYSEITEITELPEGTVKNYLFRARKMLREGLLQKYKRESL